MQVFERAVKVHPRSPLLLLGLSVSQFLGGQRAESAETSRKALRLEPDFSPARLLTAFAMYMDGKLADSERVAVQGLALPRPSPYLYYLHAALMLKRQSRQDDQILKEPAIANRTIPSCSLCSLTESKAHRAAGDIENAIADLETAVRVDPIYADAWYRLPMLYERVGRRQDAARAPELFQRIETKKENQESEMLRNIFLQTLRGPTGPTPH